MKKSQVTLSHQQCFTTKLGCSILFHIIWPCWPQTSPPSCDLTKKMPSQSSSQKFILSTDSNKLQINTNFWKLLIKPLLALTYWKDSPPCPYSLRKLIEKDKSKGSLYKRWHRIPVPRIALPNSQPHTIVTIIAIMFTICAIINFILFYINIKMTLLFKHSFTFQCILFFPIST